MPIISGSDQKNKSLKEFYSSDHQQTLEIGAKMLSLINLIDAKFIDTKIFGLTSLYKLNLLSKDSYNSPHYVSIATDGQMFRIDYLVPDSEQPWEQARVSGETESLEDAFKYILIAMTKSKGWLDSSELKKLLADT